MAKKDWHIVPECYIDTNLTEFLLDSHGVNHQKGCNAVAKKMMESNLKDQFSIGIIDNDKRQHSYVNEFTEIAQTLHVTLLKHKERPHYFIRVTFRSAGELQRNSNTPFSIKLHEQPAI